jgi:T5orf172 domain
MKSSARVSCLHVEIPLDGEENLEMDIHEGMLQMWCGHVGGDHYWFPHAAYNPGLGTTIAKMHHLDIAHRHLVEQFVAHRSDLVGEHLVAILTAMEEAIAARDGSSVYFADAGGSIKIGWSKKVSARLAQLQTGSAVPIKLLGTMPGGLAVERRVHARFAHLRLSGEWFTAAPELLAYVDEVTA